MRNKIYRRKKEAPERLGSLLDGVLGRLGLAHTLGGWKIVIRWPEIVGAKVASKARALRYEDDTLLVSVPDAVWRQELVMDTDEILRKIHQIPGGKAVRKIRFVS